MRTQQDAHAALQCIFSALAPGGFLLLHELVGHMNTALWGLLATEERACGSLGWDTETWQRALSEAGFLEVSTIRYCSQSDAGLRYSHPIWHGGMQDR